MASSMEFRPSAQHARSYSEEQVLFKHHHHNYHQHNTLGRASLPFIAVPLNARARALLLRLPVLLAVVRHRLTVASQWFENKFA